MRVRACTTPAIRRGSRQEPLIGTWWTYCGSFCSRCSTCCGDPMTRWVLMPLQRTWLLLLGATIAALWMRENGPAGLTIGATTLAIAYAKGRVVVLDFMELRRAPLLWRCLLEGWLLLISGLISAIYADSRF